MALPLPSQTPRGVQRARHALDGDSLREAPKRAEGMFIIILIISIIVYHCYYRYYYIHIRCRNRRRPSHPCDHEASMTRTSSRPPWCRLACICLPATVQSGARRRNPLFPEIPRLATKWHTGSTQENAEGGTGYQEHFLHSRARDSA